MTARDETFYRRAVKCLRLTSHMYRLFLSPDMLLEGLPASKAAELWILRSIWRVSGGAGLAVLAEC